MSRLDDFNPNSAPDPWATYIPGRYNGGTFKTHTQRGHAVAAMNRHGEGILYQFVDGQWAEVTRRDTSKAPDRCSNCGLKGEPVPYTRGYYHRDGEVKLVGVFERNPGNGRIIEPPTIVWVCKDCK